MPTFLRTAPNIYEFAGVNFFPGTTVVPDAVYKMWQEKYKDAFEKHFKLQITGPTPAMVILKDKEIKGDSLIEVITKATVKKAGEIIKNTWVISQLEPVLEVEKRKPVREAIETQINEIMRKPEPEELVGGVVQSEAPKNDNMMESLGLEHSFTKPDKY